MSEDKLFNELAYRVHRAKAGVDYLMRLYEKVLEGYVKGDNGQVLRPLRAIIDEARATIRDVSLVEEHASDLDDIRRGRKQEATNER